MTARCAPGVSWRIGSYLLRADGTFWHGERFISLTPLQRRVLLCFCRHAGELISREQLAAEVWNQDQVNDQSLARAIHGLRRVLEDCGLGGRRIATLYGSGYTFTAPVVGEPAGDLPAPAVAEPGAGGERDCHRILAREHHLQGQILARRRNPALIPAALRHLRLALELDPGNPAVVTDLCWVLLHQVGWGLVPSSAMAHDLRALLEQIPAGSAERHGVEAERLSLLDWRPAAAEPLYALARTTLARHSEATQSWARHLLATGRPAAALEALSPILTDDLPHGRRLAALALWHSHDPAAALACLDQQLRIEPSLVSTHLMVAMLQAEQGGQPEALQHLAAARRLCGRDAGFLGLHPVVTFVQARCGGERQARLLLRRAAQHPSLALPSLWGLAALELGDQEAAETWFRRAVSRRCYQAPFVCHSPVLQRHSATAVVQRFRSAMEQAFA